MLSVGEVVVPRFTMRCVNQDQVIRAMAEWLARHVRDRAGAGEGSSGPLPAPKDGGRPYNRSGQLVASIRAEYRTTRRGDPFAYVLPTGERADGIRRQVSRTVRIRKARARERKTGAPRKQFGRLYAHRNMAIAAILTYPPKDKRARNGNRGVYKVFEATDEERQEIQRIALQLARFELVDDTGQRYEGQGEASL